MPLAIRWLPLLTLLAILSPDAGSRADSSDGADREAIQAAACRWIRLYIAGDLEGLMSLYDPEVRVMLHGQPAMQGKERIREFFAAGADGARTRFDLIIDEIVVHGDIAHLISRYWLERADSHGEVAYRDSGRSLLLYRRHAVSDWLIYADIDQATPDAGWADRPRPGEDSCRAQPAD